MATKQEDQIKSYMNKIELAWKKWKDDAVKEEEKDTIEQVMKKFLKKLPEAIAKTFDWSTGLFQVAGRTAGQQQQKTNQKTNQKTEQKTEQKQRTAGQWTTKELAEYLSKLFGKPMTTKTLRRYLRSMDEYNDHVTTHYSWTGQNDEAVKRIVEFIKGKVGQSA